MSNIRILIRDTPTMLRDILEHAISHEPDMEVIHEVFMSAVPDANEPPSPDVVVIGAADVELARGTRAFLDRWPRSQMFTISSRGDRVLMYELMPRRVDMGDMSPSELIQAIRSRFARIEGETSGRWSDAQAKESSDYHESRDDCPRAGLKVPK